MAMSHHFRTKKLGESSPKWLVISGILEAIFARTRLESGHVLHLRGVILFGKMEGWSLLFTSSNASRLQARVTDVFTNTKGESRSHGWILMKMMLDDV